MQHICTHCGLSSQDGNLWCQRSECSAGNLTNILRRGEKLGELEIGSLLRFMRTASVYEAYRGEEKVIVKLAHYDAEEDLDQDLGYARHIKDEATMLKTLQEKNVSHPALPKLLPPFSDMKTLEKPYGRIVFRDHLRYFTVFEHVEGKFLRDLLNDNPQPQQQYAGWLTLTLAHALAMMNDTLGVYHMAISPDIIMVREDMDGVLRPILFDLGLHWQPAPQYRSPDDTNTPYDQGYAEWLSKFIQPTYTPPEVLKGKGRSVASTDVYALGMLMYEMLAGRPAYPYQTRTEQMVRVAVTDGESKPLNRPDLPEALTTTVETAIDHSIQNRQPDMKTFVRQLHQVFGSIPPERVKRENWLLRNRGALLGVALIVLLFLAGLGLVSVF